MAKKQPESRPPVWQVGAILFTAVLTISASAIFVRLATAAANTSGVSFSLFLSATRLLMASLLLLPTWRNLKPRKATKTAFYYAGAAGFCLACHFAAWISSLSFTSIAASTALVTTNPIWIAIIARIWFRETLTPATILGIGISLLGGLLIAWGDSTVASGGSNPLLGDGLALLGALTYSFYLLLGREAQRRGLSVSSYSVVAYTIAALVLLPLPPLLGISYFNHPQLVYVCILMMALFPQLIGHTSINWSVRWFSPTLVTLTTLFEPVGASYLGWLFFGEVPGITVLAGGLVLLVGVAVAVLGSTK